MDEPKPDQPAETEINSIEPPEDIKAQLKPDDHPQPAVLTDHAAQTPLPRTEQLILPPHNRRRAYIISFLLLLITVALIAGYFLIFNSGT